MNQGVEPLPFDDLPDEVEPEMWDKWREWEKLPATDFMYQVNRGMTGRNVGLSTDIRNIDKHTHGTHQARYYLYGADSGAGKTTLVDYMHVIRAWYNAQIAKRKLTIYYASFEIGKTEKMARWTSAMLWYLYKEMYPSDYILGRITGKLVTPDVYKKIGKAYRIVLRMMESIKFVEDALHPTMLFEALIHQHYEKSGTVLRKTPTEDQKKKGKKGYIIGYEPNDPDELVEIIIDHLALIGSEKGMDTKWNMDRMSRYFVILRNIFHTTGVMIQQFNTEMMSAYRGAFGKKTEQTIAPQRLDFGDSKFPYRDADIVWGLVKPQRDMQLFLKYDLSPVEGLGDCFVAAYLLKHRYGPSNKMAPLFMNGITGIVESLPLPPDNNPIAMEPWHQKREQIDKICQYYQ